MASTSCSQHPLQPRDPANRTAAAAIPTVYLEPPADAALAPELPPSHSNGSRAARGMVSRCFGIVHLHRAPAQPVQSASLARQPEVGQGSVPACGVEHHCCASRDSQPQIVGHARVIVRIMRTRTCSGHRTADRNRQSRRSCHCGSARPTSAPGRPAVGGCQAQGRSHRRSVDSRRCR